MKFRNLFLMTSLLAISLNSFAAKLTFCYENQTLFPYYIGDSTRVPAEKPGLGVEQVALLKELVPTLEVDYIRAPWDRCKFSLQSGRAGAIIASFKTARKELGRYPEKNGELDNTRNISTSAYSFYRNKGTNVDWDGQQLLNLNNAAVGVPQGYSVISQLEEMGLRIETARTIKMNFLKLKNKRIAAAVALELTGDFYATQPGFESLEKITIPLKSKNYFLMLSHQFVEANPEVAEQIWDAMGTIRERTPKMLEKYMHDQE